MLSKQHVTRPFWTSTCGGGWANLHSVSERVHLFRVNSRHTSSVSHRESLTCSGLVNMTAILPCAGHDRGRVVSRAAEQGRGPPLVSNYTLCYGIGAPPGAFTANQPSLSDSERGPSALFRSRAAHFRFRSWSAL